MFTPIPRIYSAGERESGVPCPHCQQEILLREMVAVCSRCGGTHHQDCWNRHGCGSYQCAPSRRDTAELPSSAIRITFDQLEQVHVPPPRATPVYGGYREQDSDAYGRDEYPASHPISGWSITAFIVALLGIPLFGIVTGLVAMLLGVVALVKRRPRQRGVVLASLAVVLGLADFIGWTVFMSDRLLKDRQPLIVADGFEHEFGDDAFQDQPAPIARALRSNVMIEVQADGVAGLLGSGMGSGVILNIRDNTAWIVTNRHVVDPKFAEGARGEGNNAAPASKLMVKIIGQPRMPGSVQWMAPHGIDLALISVPVTAKGLAHAIWDPNAKLQIGSKVFAVGNPHGLGWSHSGGEISQIRKQGGPRDVKIIQTNAPINPGNSGGGLYDEQGRLIGINTWTQDKRVAEGLGFAISFQTLLDLVPDNFKIPQQQLPTAP